jgi:hypothetical protein
MGFNREAWLEGSKGGVDRDVGRVGCTRLGRICASYARAACCTGHDTCGGTPNRCSCTPTTCAKQGKNCGSVEDGCGHTLDCGTCAGADTCGGGGTSRFCGGSDTCDAFAHHTIAGPPTEEEFTVREANGLQSIVLIKAANADVPVPPFTVGTTDSLTITATKIDQTQPATVSFSVTDLSGTVATCTVTF